MTREEALDKAIEILTYHQVNFCKSKKAVAYMNEIIEALEKIDQEPKTGWVPVSERLPEDIRPVMVTWKNNDPKSYYQYIVGKHFIGVAHYLKGKWYWYSSTTEDFLAEYGRYDGEEFDEAIEVVAWCPLPEPYKESEANE